MLALFSGMRQLMPTHYHFAIIIIFLHKLDIFEGLGMRGMLEIGRIK